MAIASLIVLLVIAAVAGLRGVLGAPPPPAVPPSGFATLAPAGPSATASPSPTGQLDAQLVGEDGRLTVLLLGSDERPGFEGIRTDTMMVLSVDPAGGAVAAASIPRDVARFPLPGGGVYAPKLNTFYAAAVRETGDRAQAGERLSRAVGTALGVEIDGYLLVGFAGVQAIVDALGGIEIHLDEPVRAAGGSILFPAGDHLLDGTAALALARTRKGDDDFERARRGQLLLVALAKALRERGLLRAAAVSAAAQDQVETNLSASGDALALLELTDRIDLDGAQRVVFGPPRYARSIGGTSYALRLDEVRAWTARWMAPLR